jgi:hypothetical protein
MTGPTTTQVEQAAVVQVSADIILAALERLFSHWGSQGEVYPGAAQDVQTVQAVVPVIVAAQQLPKTPQPVQPIVPAP